MVNWWLLEWEFGSCCCKLDSFRWEFLAYNFYGSGALSQLEEFRNLCLLLTGMGRMDQELDMVGAVYTMLRVREALGVKLLSLHIKRSQLRCFGRLARMLHVSDMSNWEKVSDEVPRGRGGCCPYKPNPDRWMDFINWTIHLLNEWYGSELVFICSELWNFFA